MSDPRPLSLKVRPMTLDDVPRVQEVGQEAWSDIASRDLGRKVKYPIRPRNIIEAYLWKEPRGCLVVEHEGAVVGAAYCHVWGKMGWFGPFEVLPEMQGKGVGRRLLGDCERFLAGEGCTLLGLETMSHIVRNVHFYLRAGYRPSGNSLIMERMMSATVEEGTGMEPVSLEDVQRALPEIRRLSARANPLADHSKEALMAAARSIGPVFVSERKGKIRGLAILHSYYPPADADHAAMRLLLVDPGVKDQDGVFDQLMRACEAWAFAKGRKRTFVRFSGDHMGMYQELISRGYKLDAANLRMSRGERFIERGSYHMAAWAG